MQHWETFTNESRIAYFTMEIGITNDIPTYSGGLGVLAGDMVKSAADLNLPMIGVTLVSRKGYFTQKIAADGTQSAYPLPWNPEKMLELLPVKTLVTIENRDVKVQAWLYRVRSPNGGIVPVIFLDTNIPGNAEEDQSITDHLYGGDLIYRLKQEIVLGIGGYRILAALGFIIRKYHMNEGHAALLTLELLKDVYRHNKLSSDAPWNHHKVAEVCVFTTHTPVAAGHDHFPYPLVEQILGSLIPIEVLKEYGGVDELNMTVLALKLSGFVNGVAKKHSEVSKAIFPGFQIHAITNGIHPFTWASPFFVNLYNDYLPGWANEPEVLVRIDSVPDEELWEAHCGAKAFLFQYVAEEAGVNLDPDILTIGFARRATSYKRGDLIFSDISRLIKLGAGRLQLIFSGKAHPHDAAGKEMIRKIIEGINALGVMVQAVYLENYNMDIASKMIPGVDLWLNTPMRPLEASGTSGMKAALNGVPNFSILDGWWIEGHIEGVTGWSIGAASLGTSPDRNHDAEDALDLYHKLEKEIIPLYYNDRPGWIRLMKNAIGKNAYYFNTHSMMRRYVTEAYIH